MQYPPSERKYVLVYVFFIVAAILTLSYRAAAAPPSDFPTDSIVLVREGAGLLELSKELEENRVIHSSFWFRTAAILLGGERVMRAGEYYLSEPQNVFAMARRIVRGDHQIEVVKVTIPEGFTVKKISTLFDDERFPSFDNEAFERAAPEGYMFPDTYFVHVTATASSTIKLLGDNFIRKIFVLMPKVEESGRSLEEIVTIASILEGEAKTPEEMEIISSILWKRLEAGMPLQVDASFVYILGKASKNLTLEDLEVKSPYNTYLYKGLPPTPISNPGLTSIIAAASPTTTPYMYFLTDNDGQMYYSRTFDEHVANKQKYLRRQ